MKQGIVIGTHEGSPWLENCLKSLSGIKWPLVVVKNEGYELGKITEAFSTTSFDEFLFLPDSVEVKDFEWIHHLFTNLEGRSVSVNCYPGPFGSYMGKYRIAILEQVGIPKTLTKQEAMRQEVEWTFRYWACDLSTVILFPELKDGSVFEEKFGRRNMILENDHLKKYKGTWWRDMLPLEEALFFRNQFLKLSLR